MIDVLPGIIENTWDAFAKKIMLVAPYARWVHVNVSDGSMGTEETLTTFQMLPQSLQCEAHILSARPEKYVRSLADAGFKRLIAHVESNDPRRFLDEAKFDEVEIGLALDGTTELEQLEPFLEEVDFVSIMTSEAGVSGGAFLPEAVEKIKLIRQNYPDLPIEVVGGITDVTVKAVKDAGATRIVAREFLFRNPEQIAEAIELLKTS